MYKIEVNDSENQVIVTREVPLPSGEIRVEVVHLYFFEDGKDPGAAINVDVCDPE